MNKTIDKKWGYEEWITNDASINYCMKKLFVKKGWQCSLHYHAVKDETFYVVSGKVNILMMPDGKYSALLCNDEKNTNYCDRVFCAGESIRVKPFFLHQFSAIEDSILIEASTYHSEEDSYRISVSQTFDLGSNL